MVNGNFDPYEMDERVKNYLKTLGVSDKDDPKYLFGKGAIETAGAQGIAGGLAQIGTVHGKTPSVDPFIKSSDKSLQGLQMQAKEPVIDPQVMEYLQTRAKHPGKMVAPKLDEWKKGQVGPNGDQYWYRTNANGQLETKVEGKAHVAPPAQAASQEKKQGLANAAAYAGQAQMGIFNRMEQDYDKAYKAGYAGPTAGKVYGLKSKFGSDVSPEFDRLRNDSERDLIEYVKAMSGTAASDKERKNIQSTLPTPDLDPGQFKIRMNATKEKLLQTINKNLLENGYSPMTMEDLEAGRSPLLYGNKKQKGNANTGINAGTEPPKAPPPPGGPQMTPEQQQELKIRRALKQGGQK